MSRTLSRGKIGPGPDGARPFLYQPACGDLGVSFRRSSSRLISARGDSSPLGNPLLRLGLPRRSGQSVYAGGATALAEKETGVAPRPRIPAGERGDRFVCRRAFPRYASSAMRPGLHQHASLARSRHVGLVLLDPRSSIAARLSTSLLTPPFCGVAPRGWVRRLAWPGPSNAASSLVRHARRGPFRCLLPAFVMPPRTTLAAGVLRRRQPDPRGERPGVPWASRNAGLEDHVGGARHVDALQAPERIHPSLPELRRLGLDQLLEAGLSSVAPGGGVDRVGEHLVVGLLGERY